MSVVAIQPNSFPREAADSVVTQCVGTVKEAAGGGFVIETAGDRICAQQAVSCLVRPEEGDEVIVAGTVEGPKFVLAILRREEKAKTIAADGDLEFDVRGELRVHARDGMEFLSPRRFLVASANLVATAKNAALEAQGARILANVVDATAERLSSRFSRVFRQVFELEHVRSGQLDYVAEGNVRLHGDNTLLTARELVKADGKQIHMG